MRATSAAVHGALAAAALAAAFVTWQRPPKSVALKLVTVHDATKQSLEKLRWDDGQRFVELFREADGVVWLTAGFKEGPASPADAGSAPDADAGSADGGLLASAPPPTPPRPPTRTLRGNERADQLWARFAPFEATRALGGLPPAKLDELGLSGSERRLAVTVAGASRRFTASKPQAGLIGNYLRDDASGDVFLLQGGLLSEFDAAALTDRRPHRFRPADVDAFSVEAKGQRADFVQRDAELPQNAKVARAATPDVPDELVKNWHERLWSRLATGEVLGRGEAPKAGAPEVALRLDYRKKGQPQGFLELGFDGARGAWMRTENTASWVAVQAGGDELLAEAQRFLGR